MCRKVASVNIAYLKGWLSIILLALISSKKMTSGADLGLWEFYQDGKRRVCMYLHLRTTQDPTVYSSS